MAGKKITSEQLAGNTDVLNDLLNINNPKPATVQENKTIEEKESSPVEKDVHLTMLVKESTRKAWKQFFIDHDLNTTQGIEIAMRHLIDDVESDEYKLSKGGLSRNLDK